MGYKCDPMDMYFDMMKFDNELRRFDSVSMHDVAFQSKIEMTEYRYKYLQKVSKIFNSYFESREEKCFQLTKVLLYPEKAKHFTFIPDLIAVPDVDQLHDGVVLGAPDLAVFIWDRFDEVHEQLRVRDAFINAGTKEVWEISVPIRSHIIHYGGKSSLFLSKEDAVSQRYDGLKMKVFW